MAEEAWEKLVAILHSIFDPAAIEALIYGVMYYWVQIVGLSLLAWGTIWLLTHIFSPARERHWLRR